MPSQIIKPESEVQDVLYPVSVFLAGSIEMGRAEPWQEMIEQELEEFGVTIFNPRRDDWDSSWSQRESNPEFNYQVNWELSRLKQADIILLYLSAETKSPISLLELGIHSEDRPNRLIVCCPDGFWRKGNVEIVCSRNGIPLHHDLESALGALKTRIRVCVSSF